MYKHLKKEFADKISVYFLNEEWNMKTSDVPHAKKFTHAPKKTYINVYELTYVEFYIREALSYPGILKSTKLSLELVIYNYI